jgi:hypothetical protein
MLAVAAEPIIEMVWALTLQDLVDLVAEEKEEPIISLQEHLQLVKVMEETLLLTPEVVVVELTTSTMGLAATAVQVS